MNQKHFKSHGKSVDEGGSRLFVAFYAGGLCPPVDDDDDTLIISQNINPVSFQPVLHGKRTNKEISTGAKNVGWKTTTFLDQMKKVVNNYLRK